MRPVPDSYRTRSDIAKMILWMLAAGLLAFGITPSTSAQPTSVQLESQVWWRKAGISVPGAVGEHIHLQATVPADGYIVTGTIGVPVKITAHNTTGRITSFRVSDGGSTVMQKWPISLGPCSDCSLSTVVNVNFGSWPTGRREMRWTANMPDNSDSKRMYQSTGWQVCIRSCTPTYRSGPYIEARGWYEGRGYANARLNTSLASVRSGGTVGIVLKPGSGGLPTRLAGVYIDPDFHNGSAGRVVKQVGAAFTGSVTLPTLPSGPHKLVLLSSDGSNAGVQVVPFVVP